MIKGIGTDIVEIKRIEKASLNYKFIERICTEKEIEEYKKRGKKVSYIAGRYAAKEAVSKAFGTGIGKISFKDIEILNNSLGKPEITILNEDFKGTVYISISHSSENAIAFCVVEE